MTYNELKEKCIEHRQTIICGFSFILIFIVGFGTGKSVKNTDTQAFNSQNHYNTSTKPFVASKKSAGKNSKTIIPTTEDNSAISQVAAPEKSSVLEASSSKNQLCMIKGNISSGGRKIYHVQGGVFYKTVHPEECFKTNAEAEAAGFIKSGR